jgi:hypothetical protein
MHSMNLSFKRTLQLTLAALALAGLAACGGGGGGDSSTPNNNNTGGTNTPTPTLTPTPNGQTTGEFSSLPAATNTAAALTMYNAQGAIGKAYVGPHAYSLSAAPLTYVFNNIFLKAQPGTTYQYESVPSPQAGQAFLSMLNAEGAKGYVFKTNQIYGTDPVGSLFVKSSARSTTYSWRAITGTFALTELNKNGADGYAYRGSHVAVNGGTIYGLYVKDNSSSATFSYLTLPAIDSATGILAEMNAQGANQSVFMGNQVDGSTIVSLYVKSSANTTPTSFTSVTAPLAQTTAELIARANTQAALGFLYTGDLAFNAGSLTGVNAASFYYKGSASLNPFNGPVLP